MKEVKIVYCSGKEMFRQMLSLDALKVRLLSKPISSLIQTKPDVTNPTNSLELEQQREDWISSMVKLLHDGQLMDDQQ